jgi:membrane protein implicated in regulation of membrane protease activity
MENQHLDRRCVVGCWHGKLPAIKTKNAPICIPTFDKDLIFQYNLSNLSDKMARFTLFAVLAVTMAAMATGFAPKISSRNNGLTASRAPTSLGVAIDTSDIKNGMTIELDGEPWKVLSFSIMKQARGAAKTTIKIKNLIKGNTIENTYRSGEKFETALIEKNDFQYTYKDGVSQ